MIAQIGLSASTIASSFGKVVSQDKGLEDYRPEDIALSLVRMVSYNIGQVRSRPRSHASARSVGTAYRKKLVLSLHCRLLFCHLRSSFGIGSRGL